MEGWDLTLDSTYQIAVFQLEEFFGTLVPMHRIVVLDDAFPVHSCLYKGVSKGAVSGHLILKEDRVLTSAEHFPTACANFSIGRGGFIVPFCRTQR